MKKECTHPFAFKTSFGKYCPRCKKNIPRITKLEDTIIKTVPSPIR